jgi:hypothetical protein
MAIFGLTKDYFEYLTLETHPRRTYTSASNESIQASGEEGSVYVFAERSKFEKEAQKLQAFDDNIDNSYSDDTVEAFRQDLIFTASITDPVQIKQTTRITFKTEDTSAKIGAGAGTSGAFDYRDLIGHSSHTYSEFAYFDLAEPWGAIRRFYFYDSTFAEPGYQKPPAPAAGTLHMVDLQHLSAVGDSSLSPDNYNVSGALEAVASATVAAVTTLSTFEATFSASATSVSVDIENIQYGTCTAPITGVIVHPITGDPLLDDDLDGDGIGDQTLPTFPYNIMDLEVVTSGAVTSINSMMDKYLSFVNDSEISSRKQTTVKITRFEPSFKLTSDSLRKNVVKDVLFPYYRTKYPSLHWAFSNYNTLNFFTSSLVPEDSALLYPSFTDETVSPSVIPYIPSGSFTFEFYVNPRYTIDNVDSYATGSFAIVDWEKLFIDFYQGGRGGTELPNLTDMLYAIPADPDIWKTSDQLGYTGFYLLADNTVDVSTEEADPNGDGLPDNPALHGTWTANLWSAFRGYIARGWNTITDKGDEAPDYDFRTGEFIAKDVKIVLNNGVAANDVFPLVGPKNIDDYRQWSVGKNELGDFDNYVTAENLANVINGHENWTAWAEKLEVYDENGQQKINEAELPLWTDDNGLNEYTWQEAIVKDEVDDINNYQKTSDGYLIWMLIGGTLLEDETTAEDAGYPEQANVAGLLWSDDDLDSTVTASATGDDSKNYTGYTDSEVGGNVTEDHENAVVWTEAAWAEIYDYNPVYVDGSAAALPANYTLIPVEADYMTAKGYVPVYHTYAVAPATPTDDELTAWALGQSYEPVLTYECTEVNGIVHFQTKISGWDGNGGAYSIITTRQTQFTWWAWEDDGAGNWAWVEHVENTAGVDEDAKEAFADKYGDAYVWNDDAGTYSIGSEVIIDLMPLPPAETDGVDETSGFHLEGGRDHVVVDREQSHSFKAGTILHMSSSYAISLVTGSHIDKEGHPDTYRIMVQLSSSADIPPSHIPYLENGQYGTSQYYDYNTLVWGDAAGATDDQKEGSNLILLSSDDSLTRNHWHHIAIRWGTHLVDDGKAQILIDGVIDSELDIPSGSCIPTEFGDDTPRVTDDAASMVIEADPSVLFIGNYFEGFNGSVYEQTSQWLDADGNPTFEHEAVSYKSAWHVQEATPIIDGVGGDGLWLTKNGTQVTATQVPYSTATSYLDADISGDISHDDLRAAYDVAYTNDTVSELDYTPVLSSTLAFNLADLQTTFNLAGRDELVYNEVVSINSDATQYAAAFFSYEANKMHGVPWSRIDDVDSESGWTADDPDPLEPNAYFLRHPLNAEIHEVKIWDEYRTLPQLWSSMATGSAEVEDNLLFYLPPYFVRESPEREVLITPFQTMTTTTDDPFNVAMSFGVGGHLLNLENFCREFVSGSYPLLLNLTGSSIDVTAQEPREANEYLFATASIRKRNLTILPCDNGKFKPDFTFLSTGSFEVKPPEGHASCKFVNDFGTIDYSLVTLNNLVPTSTLYPGLIAVDSDGGEDTSETSILAAVAGAAPENPGVAPGSVLTIFQRTRDNSSNQVTFFDASNLFYGKKIQQRTYELIDHDVTGSGGKVKISLSDNGHGTLYRSDAATPHPEWASVGNIIYEEGIAVVHSPCIPLFGKEQFEVNMAGHQNLHIMEIFVPCEAGQVNSSSNPQYKPLSASLAASDEDTEIVYITGLNFHDENLNIIARTNLAQPIVKRDKDEMVFRIKVDF